MIFSSFLLDFLLVWNKNIISSNAKWIWSSFIVKNWLISWWINQLVTYCDSTAETEWLPAWLLGDKIAPVLCFSRKGDSWVHFLQRPTSDQHSKWWWFKFNCRSQTSNIKVHVIHISRVIIIYTVESLSVRHSTLNRCGQVMPYGGTDLGQHWLS